MAHEVDIRYMQQALSLAREGIGLTSPNPTVGCVLVKNGHIVGQGYHLYDHRDHAEIVALKQAGTDAEGATAYVTLEPCSHTGRTGPCADALIRAKVARVFAATVDPNPQVAGTGLARITAAGIPVATGVLQKEARLLNDAFAAFISTKKPFVTLKAALSVDGHLAPPASQRTAKQPHWLTGPLARNEVQHMRHASDAILTGIGTVLADDPQLTDRTGMPRRRPLLRVVMDSWLQMPISSRLVSSVDDDLLIFCAEDVLGEKEQALLECGVQVERIPSQNGHLDIHAAMDHLAARNLISVFSEGGSRLNGSLLRSGVVDKVALFYSQIELGTDAIPFAEDAPSPYLLEQQLSRLAKSELGPDTLVTGYLRDPWEH